MNELILARRLAHARFVVSILWPELTGEARTDKIINLADSLAI